MTSRITIKNKSMPEVLEMVYELRARGLVTGKDFDFEYHPPVNDNFTGVNQSSKKVVFIFYNEKYASWFGLKWASNG